MAKIVSKEAKVMASKEGGLHLSKEQVKLAVCSPILLQKGYGHSRGQSSYSSESPDSSCHLTKEVCGQFGNGDSRVGVICRALF